MFSILPKWFLNLKENLKCVWITQLCLEIRSRPGSDPRQYQVTVISRFRPRLFQTIKLSLGGSIGMYYPKTLLCQGFLAECKAKGFTSFNSCGRNHLLNCPRTRHDSSLNLKSLVRGVPSKCTTRTHNFTKDFRLVQG